MNPGDGYPGVSMQESIQVNPDTQDLRYDTEPLLGEVIDSMLPRKVSS